MRRALLALVLSASAAALSGCSGDEGPVPSTDSGAVSPPLQQPVGSGVPTDAQPAQLVNVAVVGGEPTGDTGAVPVRQGSRVRLVVVAETADTLAVEGYGLTQVVPAGRSGALELVADRAGSYEVRLEQAGLLLTTLVVS